MDNRLTTAQKAGDRMPNAMRMGTSMRQPTAMKEANLSGVGYNTKVSAIERPITNHGMSGMKAQVAGPGRQIYDRSYYMTLLKSKNNEIMNEINKLKSEVDEINKDNSTYLTLERKYETLIKDVRKYEGELADYNLALDKYRSDTKPEDIEALYMHIKNQNDKQRQHLDKLFAEKRDMENQTQTFEQQIQEINLAAESKLNDLDPEQRNEYEKLKEENVGLQQEINQSRNELEEVNTRLSQAESRLKSDTLKQRAQHLKEERTSLNKRKEDLELQTNEMNLPFPEARERLLNRIKQDNAEIKQGEKDVADIRKIIDTYQKNIKEIESDLQEKKSDENEAQKYEILYQKEKEINDFMEKFEEEKTTYEGQIQNHQITIAALLEHMAKNMQRQNKLPSAGDVNNLKSDLDYKKNLLDNAENTYARLKVELEQRQNDLDKIKTLEGRIDKEMQQVTEKITQMEDEMNNKFTRTDDLKVEFDREKIKLASIKQLMQLYRPSIQKQMTYHSMKHDTKKNQLLQGDIYNRLNEIEKKLIQNESSIYAIQQYIESKGAESNYQAAFQDCMNMCHEINMDLIKKSLSVQ